MWFVNKIANPLIRLLLLSPLRGLFGGSLLLISYRGRKSGREYRLPVNYAREGGAVYIIPGMPEKKTWWRNLRGGLPVRLLIDGATLDGTAQILAPDTQADSISHALALYLRRFPSLASAHHVRRDPAGSFDPADLRAAAASVILIRVELAPQ